jgi:hypothetical protein
MGQVLRTASCPAKCPLRGIQIGRKSSETIANGGCRLVETGMQTIGAMSHASLEAYSSSRRRLSLNPLRDTAKASVENEGALCP